MGQHSADGSYFFGYELRKVSALDIHGADHRFKMVRVDTITLTTKVVQFVTSGNRAVAAFVGCGVCALLAATYCL